MTVLISGGKGGGGGDPGDDYPAQWKDAPMDSVLDQSREYNRECTSFVAWALYSRNGFNMPFYANANEWGPDAARRGYAVNNTPAVGSVAWSDAGTYGHVAYVVAVAGGDVTVEEYNEHYNGTYDKRTVPAATFAGYIHFKDAPAQPVVPTTPTTPPAPPGTTATTTPATPAPPTTTTYSETPGRVTNTWTNYTNAGGSQGPSIPSNDTVQNACKVTGFQVADGNTWWYQIASSPWNNGYYASADAFYNNGATSGSLVGTPFVDPNVPTCPTSTPSPPPPPPTYAETTGGVTNTWTDYVNAGGNEGPSIPSNATIQIACKVTGFQVADGNPWWYMVASSPWNGAYFASADAFYNNGATSGSLVGTPFVDPNVPTC